MFTLASLPALPLRVTFPLLCITFILLAVELAPGVFDVYMPYICLAQRRLAQSAIPSQSAHLFDLKSHLFGLHR